LPTESVIVAHTVCLCIAATWLLLQAVTFKERSVNEAQASEERKQLYLADVLTKMESQIIEMTTSINGLKTSVDGLATSIIGRMKEELKLVIREEFPAALKDELKNIKLVYKSS
jgi:hypothetical protein